MIKNKDVYVTSFEAAQILGFTPDHVRRMIQKGRIKATKLGHSWLIRRHDLSKVKRLRFPKSKEVTNGGDRNDQ